MGHIGFERSIFGFRRAEPQEQRCVWPCCCLGDGGTTLRRNWLVFDVPSKHLRQKLDIPQQAQTDGTPATTRWTCLKQLLTCLKDVYTMNRGHGLQTQKQRLMCSQNTLQILAANHPKRLMQPRASCSATPPKRLVDMPLNHPPPKTVDTTLKLHCLQRQRETTLAGRHHLSGN